ncbi:MAG TPA: N,N-dimethylformamidase beta subunit family domain-containing protein [Candidatus Acidoferrales bacterium]|nr:N,N-dimethylformamidase beta subunit family domain-containing protein [Candidatus Acidoferrales bacterium]
MLYLLVWPPPAFSSCTSPQNLIEAENCLPGDPSWYNGGYVWSDPSIVGFATDISVNVGQTIYFKISTDAPAYTIDIWRMGYYGGAGARQIASLRPSAPLPQKQPACLANAATGLVDCGNWAVSGSWAVPSNAVSGIYFALIRRLDTWGASTIFFIVRDDTRVTDLLFQTSDLTWQAYNVWGPQGKSLYGCNSTYNSTCRAYKVSYNRPFITQSFNPYSFVLNAEYPMVRWLEANGYNVSYISGVDTDRYGSTILPRHKTFLSVGHDEYWSGNQRANVEAARAAGVHLAFFSANEVFWKTRWENSIDGSNTPYRTLVCYKETWANGVIDPADPPTWTGTWRDPRFSPPADGGRPENALTGTIFRVNSTRVDSIVVSQAEGKMRFWRNTAMATLGSNQTIATPAGTLGYEWDADEDNGFRPAGLFDLSSSTVQLSYEYLLDYGSTFGTGTATHHLTLYRHSSGALVFGAGTVQWAWGLDSNHYNAGTPTDINMQQATVNLLADMGAQPATLQPGLSPATRSTDTVAPTSTITSPQAGSTVAAGSTVTITGTAADPDGVVAGVEVSTDGGATWHPASGRETWSYTWQVPAGETTTLRSRAVDDSGNLEAPNAGISVTLGPPQCPCAIWSSAAVPAVVDAGPDSSVELGVRFLSDTAGYITGFALRLPFRYL